MDTYDVAVVGCGPVGLALARLLSLRGLRVAAVDPNRIVCQHPDHGSRREHPSSKYSATITPCPRIVSSATSRCQPNDVVRSWNSTVDIRP